MTKLRDAALCYARRAWPVLPLEPEGKIPLTPHGVKDATTRDNIIRGWWALWPDANVGIACGAVSGIVVLDVDGAAGEEALREFGSPPTPTVITAKGAHRYFAHPGDKVRNAVRLRPSLDVRGDGGYVVAPPSVHESGHVYRWDTDNFLDDTLALALLPPKLLKALAKLNGTKQAPTMRTKSAGWQSLLDAPIREGARNATLTGIVGGYLSTGMSADAVATTALALNQSLCQPPLSDAEVRGIVASVAKAEAAKASARKKSEHRRRPALRDVEPWDEPVDGALVLAEMADMVRRFVVLSDDDATVVALWVAFAHLRDSTWASPLLAVLSATKRCGKTLLLETLSRLVPRPLLQANASTAAVFRVVDREEPTLLLDEADSWILRNDELRGVLNSGWLADSAFVFRCEGDANEPRAFSTWCPKVIAGIGGLPDTLLDRSIVVQMRRKRRDEPVQRFRRDTVGPEFEVLARKVARWVVDVHDTVRVSNPSVPDELNDRAADNWRPLLALADIAGGFWPKDARTAARAKAKAQEEGDDGVQLLADLRSLFGDTVLRMRTADILDGLHQLEAWAEYGPQQKPLSATRLAKLLKPFGVLPIPWRDGDKVVRGYERSSALMDAWCRWHPSQTPATPATLQQGTGAE